MTKENTVEVPTPIIPTIGIVVFRGDEVLLVRHGAIAGHVQGTVGIPSGRIELDKSNSPLETPREAAIRELEEETGYTVTDGELVEFEGNHFQADIPRSDGTVKKMSWEVFLAKAINGELRPGNDETIPEWHEIRELDELTLLPNVKNAITAALKHLEKE